MSLLLVPLPAGPGILSPGLPPEVFALPPCLSQVPEQGFLLWWRVPHEPDSLPDVLAPPHMFPDQYT